MASPYDKFQMIHVTIIKNSCRSCSYKTDTGSGGVRESYFISYLSMMFSLSVGRVHTQGVTQGVLLLTVFRQGVSLCAIEAHLRLLQECNITGTNVIKVAPSMDDLAY